MLRIALPKGRLGDKAYRAFANVGWSCPALLEDSRKLIFENREKGVSFFLVKPSDVAVYVEQGAADIGVIGKDVLLETQPDVFELLDLQMGKCILAVAGPKKAAQAPTGTLRVATKYPNVAKRYYQSISQKIQLFHLHGSIELAPCVGLSDVIVDIVETGSTLRENQMEVLEKIAASSARLIANKASYQFHRTEIDGLVRDMEKELSQ